MIPRCPSVLWVFLAAAAAVVCAPARAEETDVYVSGTQGYHTFRIPAVIVTKKGTVLAFAEGRKGGGKGRILYSGPGGKGRDHMTVRMSYDECKTWPVAKVLYAGSAAYSCLTVLPDGSIGCLYEKDGYRKITFARFTLDWLTDEKDSLKPKPSP